MCRESCGWLQAEIMKGLMTREVYLYKEGNNIVRSALSVLEFGNMANIQVPRSY